MPWAKRADGTWGNVTVEAPVLDSQDSQDENTADTKPKTSQSNLVAARAAQFQAVTKAKLATQTWGNVIVEAPGLDSQDENAADMEPTEPPSNLVAARAAQFQAVSKVTPSISKNKRPPPVPAEKMSPAPPPYAPAFPPRRTPPEEYDEAEVTRLEPRTRVISHTASLPAMRRRAPPTPAAFSTDEDPVEAEPTGIRRPPPPIPPSRPILATYQTLSVDSRPPLPSRQTAKLTPPPPSRPSSQFTPPLPPRQAQSIPPLPPRAPSAPPPLPSRYTPDPTEREAEEAEEEAEAEAEPVSSGPPTRNSQLRPPPTRTKSASSSDRIPSAPSWSSSKTGFAKGKAVEMARNRRDCLNPPPACFARPAPPTSPADAKGILITYAPLDAPIILRSNNSNDLAKAITTGRAFPVKPRPLLGHDVQREDWDRLWDDIDETARIEMRASAGLSVATLPLMPIFGAGFAVSTIAERKLRAARVGPTCKLIEAWNINFFRPRKLDIYIAQNSARLSGPSPTTASRKAPDPAFIKWQQAESPAEKQLALKEYERGEGKFRFVVQSWPPV
ncbi:hypothetical protein DFH06DRAFT_190476 [Mycena polygramma]|nr:hypothetical protein DFH06DRAFT_190476 [Mycena polygramma]